MKKEGQDKGQYIKEKTDDKSKTYKEYKKYIVGSIFIIILIGVILDNQDSKITDEADAINFLNVNAEILVTVLAVTMSFSVLGLQFLAESYTPRAIGEYLKDIVIACFLALYVFLITFSMFSVTFPEKLPPVIAIQIAFPGTIFSLVYLIYFIDHIIKKIQPDKIIRNTVEKIQEKNWKLIIEKEGKLDSADPGFRPFIILEQTLLKSVKNNDIGSFNLGMRELGRLLEKWLVEVIYKEFRVKTTTIVNEIKKIEKEINGDEIEDEIKIIVDGINEKIKKEIEINGDEIEDEIKIIVDGIKIIEKEIKIIEKEIKIIEKEIKKENSDEEWVKKQKSILKKSILKKSILRKLLKIKKLEKLELEFESDSEYVYSFFFKIFSELFAECKINHREQLIIKYQNQLFEQIIMMYEGKRPPSVSTDKKSTLKPNQRLYDEYRNMKAAKYYWIKLDYVGKEIIELKMTFATESFIKNMDKLMKTEFKIIHKNNSSKFKIDRIVSDDKRRKKRNDPSDEIMKLVVKVSKIDKYVYEVLASDQLSRLEDFGNKAACMKSEKLVHRIFKNLTELLLETMNISYGTRRKELCSSIIECIYIIHLKTMEAKMRYSFSQDYFKNIIENMDKGWETEKEKIIENFNDEWELMKENIIEDMYEKSEELKEKTIKNTYEMWGKGKENLIKKICEISKDGVKCYMMYDEIDKLINRFKYFVVKHPKLALITLDALIETYDIISEEKDSQIHDDGRDEWNKRTEIYFNPPMDWIPKHSQEIVGREIAEIVKRKMDQPRMGTSEYYEHMDYYKLLDAYRRAIDSGYD